MDLIVFILSSIISPLTYNKDLKMKVKGIKRKIV